MTTHDFKVADLSLHEFGRREIALAEHGPSRPLTAPGSQAACT